MKINSMLGIFKMNSQNISKINAVLQKYDLKEMPEANDYLQSKNEILDCTTRNSKPEDFIEDLLVVTQIKPNQITDCKVEYHKKFLDNYLKKNPQINYSTKEFWQIREECIAALRH